MISSVLIFSLQALIFCFLVNVINKIKVLKISFVRFSEWWKIKKRQGSVPTILPLQVRVPSTPSKLASIVVKFVLYLSCEKNEKKQKEAGFGPFCFKKRQGSFESHKTCCYCQRLHTFLKLMFYPLVCMFDSIVR